MKTISMTIAGLGLCALSAAAQQSGGTLSPPVNVVQAANTSETARTSGMGEAQQRQSMVIEEDGTVRFLTPQEAAELFLPSGTASRFDIDIDQPASGAGSLRIEVSGAHITDSISSDGSTRILRIEPVDGSPGRLITITKD